MTDSSSFPIDPEPYRARIVRYVRYLLKDAGEAEDLAQETFIRAHREQETLRDPMALESWLYRIATHLSIDRLRQRARTNARHADSPVEELELADQKQASPFVVIQQEEMGECIDQYVAELPDSEKAVLLLHDTDGLTANEIGEMLDLPLTTVKMRLHRARKRLRTSLNDGCTFGRDDRGVFICEPKSRGKGEGAEAQAAASDRAPEAR